jgi:hypothetical protein
VTGRARTKSPDAHEGTAERDILLEIRHVGKGSALLTADDNPEKGCPSVSHAKRLQEHVVQEAPEGWHGESGDAPLDKGSGTCRPRVGWGIAGGVGVTRHRWACFASRQGWWQLFNTHRVYSTFGGCPPAMPIDARCNARIRAVNSVSRGDLYGIA